MRKLKRFIFGLLVLVISGVVGGRLLLDHLGGWLTRADKPMRADVVLCLGGGAGRFALAKRLLDDGYSHFLMVTTEGSLKRARAAKVAEASLIFPEKFATTTYDEAQALAEVMRERGFSTAVVVSDAYHMYRVRWSFARVCRDLPVTLRYVSGRPGAEFWWRERWSRLYVAKEVSKLLYYWVDHGLLGIKHDPVWMSDVKRWYCRVLEEVV